MNDVLQILTETIQERMESASGEASYVAKLHASGLDKILEKVGEEAIEVILAAKHAEQFNNNDKLVHETADLLFHILVMLAAQGTDLNEVLSELENRFGTSGIAEKEARKHAGNDDQ